MIRDVHLCVTVDFQQIGNGNIANQIHRYIIDYGKFILKSIRKQFLESTRSDWLKIVIPQCATSFPGVFSLAKAREKTLGTRLHNVNCAFSLCSVL